MLITPSSGASSTGQLPFPGRVSQHLFFIISFIEDIYSNTKYLLKETKRPAHFVSMAVSGAESPLLD